MSTLISEESKDSVDKVLKAVTDKIRNNHCKQLIEILSEKILKTHIYEGARTMKNKMKTTEMEDFEILYKNIGNEVIKERIRSSGQWYIERAIQYKRYFYSLSIISIILPLIISSVNILGVSWENEVRIVTTIASAIVSMVTGLLTFTKCGEKWTLYRSTIEMIKSELTLFWTKTPVPDEKDLVNLTYRLEEIMNKEHSRWKKMQQEDDKITLKSNEKNEETGK